MRMSFQPEADRRGAAGRPARRRPDEEGGVPVRRGLREAHEVVARRVQRDEGVEAGAGQEGGWPLLIAGRYTPVI